MLRKTAFGRNETSRALALLALFTLVAHRGFEPLISALRGRCPRPLDECAVPLRISATTPRGQGIGRRWRTAALASLAIALVANTACSGSKSKEPPPSGGDPLTPALHQVLEDVAKLRALPAPTDIKAATTPRDQVRALIAGMLSDEDRAAFEQLTALYRLMGLIGPNDDYEQLYLDFAARAVIGFYRPSDKILWLVDEDSGLDFASFEPTLQSTVAHELVHSVQDGSYNFESLLSRAAADPDWSLALSAVIEGDAVHYERLWAAEHHAGNVGVVPERGISGSGIPAALERELRFPYDSGLDWVDLKGSLDGNAATNAALEGRRITTAQILHPELGDGWQPATVKLPDLSNQLGSGWKRVSQSSFGEFRLRNFLQLRLTGLPAVAGASGWAGDQYALYQNGDESVATLEVAFDSPQNADEFMSAMDSWLQAPSAATGSEAVVALPDGRGIAIRRTATNTVLLAFGSNVAVTKRIAAE